MWQGLQQILKIPGLGSNMTLTHDSESMWPQPGLFDLGNRFLCMSWGNIWCPVAVALGMQDVGWYCPVLSPGQRGGW